MDGSGKYHHGALKAELLKAAEIEISENGIENFSLRRVAKRAGVSHAAPAHHFRDAGGLLTALAARGFDKLLETAEARDPGETASAQERVMSYGQAYVDFALRHHALFRLCFASDRPDYQDPGLKASADAAFLRLASLVARHDRQDSVEWSVNGLRRTYAIWSQVHGVADLLASRKMHFYGNLDEAERDAVIKSMLQPLLASPDRS